jgi:hypothetical protein
MQQTGDNMDESPETVSVIPTWLKWVILVPVGCAVAYLLYSTFYLVPFKGQLASQYRSELNNELIRAYNASATYLNKNPSETVTSVSQLIEGGWTESAEVKLISVRMSTAGGEIKMLHLRRSKLGSGYSGEGSALDDGKDVTIKLPD